MRGGPRALWIAAVVAALGLAGCGEEAPASSWRLVGAYDAATLMAMRPVPEGEEPPSYLWNPYQGMTESCGPAKAPDGLGVFEAEAVTNRLSPTLAVVLERTGAAAGGPLTPGEVRVALGHDRPQFLLQPAVQPRHVVVRIEGDGDVRYEQLVRTQMQMELCMEHKTGRGWLGGDEQALRQAFLLDPPDEPSWGPDRRYFGGQRDPIPALLGPPDACVAGAEDDVAGGGVPGGGSMDLVPSDVWGATLRACEIEEARGMPVAAGGRTVPLKLVEPGEGTLQPSAPTWEEIRVVVGPGLDDEEVRVDLFWQAGDGEEIEYLTDFPLFPENSGGEGEAGMTDLLARVPYRYPSLGPADDPDRYVVLLVPNWQVVEGLRRLDEGSDLPLRPRGTGGEGVQYGVGWVLEHPHVLFVQVPLEGSRGARQQGLPGEPDPNVPDTWLNLSEIMVGGAFGFRRWGYTVGMLSGREPIALPSELEPEWTQTAAAQRAAHQSLFLGCVMVLLFVVLAGLRRLGDLWVSIPEERVDYWPGRAAEGEAAGGDEEAPEGGEEGGGEGGESS